MDCIAGYVCALLSMPSLKVAMFIWGLCCAIDNIGWLVVYHRNKDKLTEDRPMNNVFISSAKKNEVVENFVKSKREELEKMIPGFVDDRKFTDIVLNFYERGIRDGAQMMLERMTDIIAARNATHVSAQMSEASASGKLNDAFNEKNKEDWR